MYSTLKHRCLSWRAWGDVLARVVVREQGCQVLDPGHIPFYDRVEPGERGALAPAKIVDLLEQGGHFICARAPHRKSGIGFLVVREKVGLDQQIRVNDGYLDVAVSPGGVVLFLPLRPQSGELPVE